MDPISSIQPIARSAEVQRLNPTTTGKTEGAANGSFSSLINSYLSNTNADQVASEQAVEELVTGKTDNIQGVVMAVANAEMSFQLFMEIRNKLIDSYNELMRMQF